MTKKKNLECAFEGEFVSHELSAWAVIFVAKNENGCVRAQLSLRIYMLRYSDSLDEPMTLLAHRVA